MTTEVFYAKRSQIKRGGEKARLNIYRSSICLLIALWLSACSDRSVEPIETADGYVLRVAGRNNEEGYTELNWRLMERSKTFCQQSGREWKFVSSAGGDAPRPAHAEVTFKCITIERKMSQQAIEQYLPSPTRFFYFPSPEPEPQPPLIRKSNPIPKPPPKNPFPLVLTYISIGGGPDYSSVQTAKSVIKQFEQDLEIKLAFKKVFWGREGEADVCYSLSEINREQRKKLIALLRVSIKPVNGIHFVYVRENVDCREVRNLY